jgi:hypothetical protein
MVNVSELPINVVNASKPKMLTGLNQNGKWSSSKVTTSFDVDISTTGEKAAPNPLWYSCGTW